MKLRCIPRSYRNRHDEESVASRSCDVMKWIIRIGTNLAFVVGVGAANAQGVGYAPGVNPSNPQDLTYRSNPQDLLAPGGSNPQDLVRRPPAVSGPLPRNQLNSAPSSQSYTSGLQYTVKAKPK